MFFSELEKRVKENPEKCLTSKLGSVIIILQTKLGKGGKIMEEKENLVETEEVEEKTNALTKEEILAKSREENKNGDEMQKSGEKWAAGLPYRSAR